MFSASIIQTLRSHSTDVTSLDCCNGILASASGDKTIRIYRQNDQGSFSETKYSPFRDHKYGVNCIRFSPSGNILASVSTDGQIILWNIKEYERINPIDYRVISRQVLERIENEMFQFVSEEHRICPLRACAFSPSSVSFATGGDDEVVSVFNLVNRTSIRYLTGHGAMIASCSFSPDSNYLATCSSAGEVIFWDGRYGHRSALYCIKNAHDLHVLCCDFSPQIESTVIKGFDTAKYTLCTTGLDHSVKIWIFRAGFAYDATLKFQLKGHEESAMTCKFSADGFLLATAGGDKMVRIWNPATGEQIACAIGHDRYITCCIFLSEKIFATGSSDKRINIWELQESTLLSVQTEKALQSFSLDIPLNSCVETWGKHEVVKWLEKIEQEHLICVFMENDICGIDLLSLDNEILEHSFKIKSLGQRNKILREIKLLKNPLWKQISSDSNDGMSLVEFNCPITHEVMHMPVIAVDGYTYEKTAIEEWFRSGKNTSPMTNELLDNDTLIPNLILLQLIKKFKNLNLQMI